MDQLRNTLLPHRNTLNSRNYYLMRYYFSLLIFIYEYFLPFEVQFQDYFVFIWLYHLDLFVIGWRPLEICCGRFGYFFRCLHSKEAKQEPFQYLRDRCDLQVVESHYLKVICYHQTQAVSFLLPYLTPTLSSLFSI